MPWWIVCLLSMYVVLDVAIVRVWRSEEALWAQAHRVSPTSVRAFLNLEKARAIVPRD